MAARGTAAKDEVFRTIQKAFGKDWIGVFDKKGYVWADENGERIQVAISLTCPKNFVESTMGDFDFEIDTKQPQSTTISQEERESIELLMERLGL